ncbi:Zinc-ribbon, partial [Teratosphaeria destructans]
MSRPPETGAVDMPRHDGRMDGPLPDDDGMRGLRAKLHEIRTLAVSTEEKARRMHQLMTHDFWAHRSDVTGRGQEDMSPGGAPEGAGPGDPRNPYNVHPPDFEPTFSPRPVRHPEDTTDEAVDDPPERPPILGCPHYQRNVKVQCFDCRRWFPCRHCHDAAPDLPFRHQLNRKKTENMLCMLCRTPQPAAEACVRCGEYAAWYYCPKCKLWDNDNNKRIYHCDDCGICRVGEGLGKDYVHCRRCNVCISIATSASHPCIERATEGDCPLCLVRLFESSTPVVSLPCGHYMHGECYRDLMAVTYKCPVCSKSAVNMDVQWRKLDDEIAAQPMPEEDDGLPGLLPT